MIVTRQTSLGDHSFFLFLNEEILQCFSLNKQISWAHRKLLIMSTFKLLTRETKMGKNHTYGLACT